MGVQSVPHFHSQINCYSNKWVSNMSSIILKVLFGRFNYCIWMSSYNYTQVVQLLMGLSFNFFINRQFEY